MGTALYGAYTNATVESTPVLSNIKLHGIMMKILVPEITIDTNCVIGLFDSESQTATSTNELREIMRFAMSGDVTLAITTRVEVDFQRDKDDRRRAEMLNQISMIPVVGTVARWDQSKLDGADVLADLKDNALLSEVQRIVFPGLNPESGRYQNKLADIDHLVGHKLAGRDVFVTDDRDILRRHRQLRDGVGILVMSPAEALCFIDGHHARHQRKPIASAHVDDSYWDKRLKGSVIFDYSNNEHRFCIGDGLFFFETQW
jgi:hypothetical protein